MLSLVIPVYRNAENLPRLFTELEQLASRLPVALEVVFVVDGSPDASIDILRSRLSGWPVRSQLLELSRNVGSFAAIAAGLAAGRGDYFAVMAADMQEPPELIVEFDRRLRSGSCDVVLGTRATRADPLLSRLGSGLFWWAYRRWVQREIPKGGVDIFGCSRQVRDEVRELKEGNSSLIGLLFWVGFRRELVAYHRRPRPSGRSAWTLTKKLRYLSDSVFNFTDLPVRLLFRIGSFGTLASIVGGAIILLAKLSGQITIPGYTATTLIVVFFGTLNCLGLGIIGGYVWRTLENTKGRPNYLIASRRDFGADGADGGSTRS